MAPLSSARSRSWNPSQKGASTVHGISAAVTLAVVVPRTAARHRFERHHQVAATGTPPSSRWPGRIPLRGNARRVVRGAARVQRAARPHHQRRDAEVLADALDRTPHVLALDGRRNLLLAQTGRRTRCTSPGCPRRPWARPRRARAASPGRAACASSRGSGCRTPPPPRPRRALAWWRRNRASSCRRCSSTTRCRHGLRMRRVLRST